MPQLLIIDQFGSFVGKKSERLVVKMQGKVVDEVPFADLEQVTIATGGATISSDAVAELVEHGVPVYFMTSTGKPYGMVSSPILTGTVAVRRAQMAAYNDARGVTFAKASVSGKIRNQASVIKYFAKHRRTSDVKLYEMLWDGAAEIAKVADEIARVEASTIEEARGQLLSAEGRAADKYWTLVQVLLAQKVEFPGREHQGATDPVNAMLNYGYGVLYNEVWGALVLAGLEPFAGFLHVDRPGKPSLVLDFIEEFRQQVVDRPVMAELTRGYEPRLEEGHLDVPSRRHVADAVLERLQDQEAYDGRKHRLHAIVQLQARRLAGFLLGEDSYKAWVGSW